MKYKVALPDDVITHFRTNIYGYITWGNNPKLEPIVAICIALVILVITVGTICHRKQNVSRKKSLYNILPRIQWTIFNLSIIDALITVMKIRKHGVRVCDKLVEKLGANFTCMIPGHRVVVVSDPKIIQKVLSSSDPSHLNKSKFLYQIAFTNELKDSIMIADFDIWSHHRKAISPAYNYKHFPNFLKIMNEEGKCLVKTACDSATSGNGSVDKDQFKNLLEYHVTKLLARIVIGSESTNISEKDWDQLSNRLTRINQLATYRAMNPLLWIPLFWAITKMKVEMDKLQTSMREFVTKIIDLYKIKGMKEKMLNNVKMERMNITGNTQRAENKLPVDENVNSKIISRDSSSESVVEHMMSAGLTNKAIQDDLQMSMMAGRDTSIIAMHFLLFHLASNVQIQKKCQDEIFRLMNTYGYTKDENFSLEHFSELKYLERCILESLRLTPPGPALMRRMDKGLDIDEEFMIEAGEYVMIVPWGIHRNPKDFPNTETFDPDRFLSENMKKRHFHSFIPFSMGSRNCVGWKIALLQLKVLTGWILRNFEVTTNDKPIDVKILFGLTIVPERPYDLQFKLWK